MIQYSMVIDLQKCVGCGACAIGCKAENNTAGRTNGQTHNWADFVHETSGRFPNVSYRSLPVLCNHCSDAPCVKECPTEPTALFKTPDGMTLRNEERCIGCQSCQDACPYSLEEVKNDDEYSVISYNEEEQPYDPFYADGKELIPGCTSSGQDMVKLVGANPPYKTSYKHREYSDTGKAGIIEKCIFCDHRVKAGKQPACVEACPSGARVFGDANNSSSEVAQLLRKHKSFVLKPEEGTKPNVHYIREYKKSM